MTVRVDNILAPIEDPSEVSAPLRKGGVTLPCMAPRKKVKPRLKHPAKPKVLFLVGKGGGGHKATADAVRDCLMQPQQGDTPPDWDIDIIELSTLMFQDNLLTKVLNFDGDEIYNWALSHDHEWMVGVLNRMAGIASVLNGPGARDFCSKFFRDQQPCMVVSFIPFFNVHLRQSLLEVDRACPFWTVITDFEHSPSHVWIDQFDSTAVNHSIICGTSQAAEQAISHGYPEGQVMRTSGMIVHPIYHEHSNIEPSLTLSELGLNEANPTVMLFFGGYAPDRLHNTVMTLVGNHPVNVVVVCGKNQGLLTRLETSLKGKDLPVVLEGFIPANKIVAYMRLCKCVIGKAGPGVVSEAAVLKVPMIIEAGKHLLPQERCVVDWVERHKAGLILGTLDTLPDNLFQQVDGCAAALQKIDTNTAVFDVSKRLQEVVQKSWDARVESHCAQAERDSLSSARLLAKNADQMPSTARCTE